VERCGRGLRIEPRRVATAAISEATEGLLVTVKGKISKAATSDLPYGYKFSVDDGSGEVQIFVNVQTGIDVDALLLGQKVSVTGFSSQFDDHYEIDPRSPGDVALTRR
jgi:DNA/RNA endonuclease YhcR with UshA esterase domain